MRDYEFKTVFPVDYIQLSGLSITSEQESRMPWRNLQTSESALLEFLLEVAESNSLSKASAKVHVSYQSVKNFLNPKHHSWWPEFADQVARAQEMFSDKLVEEAKRRAVDGVDQPIFHKGEQVGTKKVYSDRMLELLLKATRPEFQDKKEVKHTGDSGGGGVLVVPIQAAQGKVSGFSEEQVEQQWLEECQDDITLLEEGKPDETD